MREADRQQWERSTTIANNVRITVGGPFREGCIIRRGVLDGAVTVRFPNGVEADWGMAKLV